MGCDGSAKGLNVLMDQFKLDKTAFKGHTQMEGSSHAIIFKEHSLEGHLRIAGYLVSVA